MANTEFDIIKTRYTIPNGPLIDNKVLDNVVVTDLTFCKGHRQIPVGIDQTTSHLVIGLGETKIVVPPSSQPVHETNHLCNQLHCGLSGENCAAKKLAETTGQSRNTWTDILAELVRVNRKFRSS